MKAIFAKILFGLGITSLISFFFYGVWMTPVIVLRNEGAPIANIMIIIYSELRDYPGVFMFLWALSVMLITFLSIGFGLKMMGLALVQSQSTNKERKKESGSIF